MAEAVAVALHKQRVVASATLHKQVVSRKQKQQQTHQQQSCQQPRREVSNREVSNHYDRDTQIQKHLLSILSEGTVTVTKIDGHNELLHVYFKQLMGKLLSSFTCLISNIEQKNKFAKLTVYDGEGVVAKEGFLPAHYELCFMRLCPDSRRFRGRYLGRSDASVSPSLRKCIRHIFHNLLAMPAYGHHQGQ